MSGSKYLEPSPLAEELPVELSCKTEGLLEGCDVREIELAQKFGGRYEKPFGFWAPNKFIFPDAKSAAAFVRAREGLTEFRSPSDEILDLPFDALKKIGKGVGEGANNLLSGLGLDLKKIVNVLLIVAVLFAGIGAFIYFGKK